MEQSRYLSIPELSHQNQKSGRGEAYYGGRQSRDYYNIDLQGQMPSASDTHLPPPPPPPPLSHAAQDSVGSDTLPHTLPGRQKRKHASSEVTRSAMSYPRKRAVRACQLCRTRKTKCNNIRPTCGSCNQIGAPCLYEDAIDLDHSSFDPASLLMLDRLNQIIGTLNTYVVPQASAGLSLHARSPGAFPAAGLVLPTSRHPSSAHSGSFNDYRLNLDQVPTPRGSIAAHTNPLDEPSPEYLQIPSCRTNADTILQWPVFEGKYPPNSLVGELVLTSGGTPGYGQSGESRRRTGTGSFGVQEEEIEGLIEDFLSLVHIKNPVLDPDSLRSYTRKVVEDGPGWDAHSCLVYLACALGCLAQTFQRDEMELSSTSHDNREISTRQDNRRLRRAESYYNIARKRIGLLSPSIITAQCFFISAIYLMYTIHPLEAWHNFHQASTLCHMCLQFSKDAEDDPTVIYDLNSSRRSEQRLYWSCFKSECEMRVEIELPISALGAIDYPYLFPSPPNASSPASDSITVVEEFQQQRSSLPGATLSVTSRRYDSSIVPNQDQSWYYYLSEIALRRIGNRVLNTFYMEDMNSWFTMHISSMVAIANDFETQLTQWANGLPESLRYKHIDRRTLAELPYVLQARIVEIQSWLCRPFLFYAVHHPQHNNQDTIQPFVSRAITCSLHLIENVSHRHRHHGTWLGLRNSTAAALLIVAAVKCCHISVPSGWRESVEKQISTLKYWETESPDIEKSRLILETALDELIVTNLPVEAITCASTNPF